MKKYSETSILRSLILRFPGIYVIKYKSAPKVHMINVKISSNLRFLDFTFSSTVRLIFKSRCKEYPRIYALPYWCILSNMVEKLIEREMLRLVVTGFVRKCTLRTFLLVDKTSTTIGLRCHVIYFNQ